MTITGESLTQLLNEPTPSASASGFVAQAIGSSATVRYSAIPEMFVALMGGARHELVITTPYYVPDDPIQAALCGAARRRRKHRIASTQRFVDRRCGQS